MKRECKDKNKETAERRRANVCAKVVVDIGLCLGLVTYLRAGSSRVGSKEGGQDSHVPPTKG